MGSNINLNDIYIFHDVCEFGNITAASKKLKTSKQNISRKLAQLEESLGVTLIARNTRKFELTAAGQDYYKSCSKIIEQIELANAMVRKHKTEMDGKIKISIPYEFSNNGLCNLLTTFMLENPGIKLDVNLSDRNGFSLCDGVDLVVHLGKLEDSCLIAKPMGGVNYGLVSSPGYLERVGVPQECNDLYRHTYINVSKNSGLSEKDSPLKKCRQLVVSDFTLAKQFVTQGFGLVRLPLFICEAELRNGDLVILPNEHCFETKPLNLVFLKDKYMPCYVRKLVDYIASVSKEASPWIIDSHTYLYHQQEVSLAT